MHAFPSVQFKMRAGKECEGGKCSIHYKFRRRPPTSVIYNGKRIQRPDEAHTLGSGKLFKLISRQNEVISLRCSTSLSTLHSLIATRNSFGLTDRPQHLKGLEENAHSHPPRTPASSLLKRCEDGSLRLLLGLNRLSFEHWPVKKGKKEEIHFSSRILSLP